MPLDSTPHSPPRVDWSQAVEIARERIPQGTRVVDLQPHQTPPPGEDWKGWVLLAGRGAGKSFAGMHWLDKQAQRIKGLRARVIAPTFGDGVSSCVEGPNGLIQASGGKAHWKPSEPGGAMVYYPETKSRIWVIGTPTPGSVDRLRALTNIEIDVFEEAFANTQLMDAWKQASLSRRRGNTKFVVTSTPRPHPLIKKWQEDERVVLSRAVMSDNKYNDPDWVKTMESMYAGTRLYRQEIAGEVIEEVDGALWTPYDVERSSYEGVRDELIEGMGRVVVGVDPPSGPGTCGIIVVGRDDDGHLYVLDDYSKTDATPSAWANAVAAASSDYGALVVAETNQGGRMVSEVLTNAKKNLPLTLVNASKGKQARAEPIALMWEADHQTAHMAPSEPTSLDKLVEELTTWVPGDYSPDRLDAMVWACTYLSKGAGVGTMVDLAEMDAVDPDETPGAFNGAQSWRYQ